MDSDALVPAQYIDGQVTLLLHFGDLRDGRGGIDPLKVQTIFGGVPSWCQGYVVAVAISVFSR